jgi:ATP-dependent RNA circularization protein (DNA/RNA ligase family)
MSGFIKFPRTFHIPGSKLSKSDKYLGSEDVRRLFKGPVHVSEKVDGANVSVHCSGDGQFLLQKRSGVITEDHEHFQYNAFRDWVYSNYDKLKKLPLNLVLFGEWLKCTHSVKYTKLPDYFLLFDVYDKEAKKWLGVPERDRVAKSLGIHIVPEIAEKKLVIEDIPGFIKKSFFSDQIMEGVIIRNGANGIRGKYVRGDFVQGNIHWDEKLEFNGLG